jgi:catechol 2,3-dioxygenase-like lactoylglutathione lyase family enzyme
VTVARHWRGATRAEDADDYVDYLEATGIAGYLATPGNRGAEILRRVVGEKALFTVRSTWRALADVRAFAGDAVEVARFYPEDDRFLVEREETVDHDEVVRSSIPAAAVATFDHIALPVRDLARSLAFYEAALAPLGIARVARGDDGSAGFGRDGDDAFWVAPGNGSGTLHLAFTAEGHDAVDAFHAAALAAGGRDNGGPGLRTRYHADYYGAYVLDPDGNNVEAVCHVPGRRNA